MKISNAKHMLMGLVWAWTLPLWAQSEILESFEAQNYWQVANWGDEAKSAPSEEQVSDGKKSLELHFDATMKNQGKGVVLERDLSSVGREFNKFSLDIYNKGPAKLSIAIAVETDEYFESQAVPLEKGWNRDISFYLQKKTYKSKSTNWEHQASVNLSSPLKKIFLIFYRGNAAEGTFFLDRLMIAQEDRAPVEDALSVPGAPSRDVERGKKHHYRPRGLPIEIFIRS